MRYLISIDRPDAPQPDEDLVDEAAAIAWAREHAAGATWTVGEVPDAGGAPRIVASGQGDA